VAKPFVTLCVKGILYKLTILNFPTYVVKPYPHIFTAERFKRPSSKQHSHVAACGLVWTRADMSSLLLTNTARRKQTPRPVQFFGEPVQCFETARYIGVTLDTQLTRATNANQTEKKQLKDWACFAPYLIWEVSCPSEMACCFISSSSVLWWLVHARSGDPLLAATFGSCKCCNPIVFILRLTNLGKLVRSKFTRIWGFHFSPTTPGH
jgi:hypothetical protein